MVCIYLDDVRLAPEGWLQAFDAVEAIQLLATHEGKIKVFSFDHDLGEDKATGYDVLKWIEDRIATTNYIPPREMEIHSANPVDRERMRMAIQSIRRLERKNNQASAKKLELMIEKTEAQVKYFESELKELNIKLLNIKLNKLKEE